jgi:hypothetical protein
MLDAIQKTLVGESDKDISSRLAKDLNDFKRCVHNIALDEIQRESHD